MEWIRDRGRGDVPRAGCAEAPQGGRREDVVDGATNGWAQGAVWGEQARPAIRMVKRGILISDHHFRIKKGGENHKITNKTIGSNF